MPNMEKAGIIIVGALIAIIVAVGLMNRPSPQDENASGGEKSGTQSNEAETPKSGGGASRVIMEDGAKKPEVSKKDLEIGSPVVEPVASEANRPNGGGTRIDGTSLVNELVNGAKTPPSVDLVDGDGWPKEYVIKKDDHFTKIATVVYDDPAMAREIEKANPGVDPRGLHEGDKIQLPRPTKPLVATPGAGSTVGGDETPVNVVDGRSSAPGVRPVSKTSKSSAPASSSKVKRPAFLTPEYVRANLASLSSKKSTGKTYKVKSGDTLESIARKQLGSVKYADELRRANPTALKDPNKIRAGVVLSLPSIN